jgi:hypothetical protein
MEDIGIKTVYTMFRISPNLSLRGLSKNPRLSGGFGCVVEDVD